ncbi:MAG: response regulator transcription factor [Elusimicrobia bacterium]|nr:response regulator transcription factor [Elusimicrobiota bacterium]
MKLLIVEDDADTASFVRYVLEQERYTVKTAATAFEARGYLKSFKPDLIILDRGLPDADGLDFCRELKLLPRCAHIPVLFLSAAKSPADVVDGFNSGASDYVTKPFGFVELVARVQALLRKPGLTGMRHA